MTSQLSHRLEEMDVQLELSEEVKVWIAENAYEPAYGARPLKRYLTKVIENPLAKLIIGGKIPPKSKVIVTLKRMVSSIRFRNSGLKCARS